MHCPHKLKHDITVKLFIFKAIIFHVLSMECQFAANNFHVSLACFAAIYFGKKTCLANIAKINRLQN